MEDREETVFQMETKSNTKQYYAHQMVLWVKEIFYGNFFNYYSVSFHTGRAEEGQLLNLEHN